MQGIGWSLEQESTMAVNISGLRRNIKNVAHNYTDAQVKVREATSNDPWGPSSTMMSEIADLTYNVVAFSEIMQMIWKRLNDHGKNWRHVYKALVLLEYLIKTGSEKVAQQCKENIFAIQTLKDFQYLDDNKDQGINVREKAKALVALLKDDERLKNERVRALKAKERFAQSTAGIGSDTVYNHPRGDRYETTIPVSHPDPYTAEMEAARPQTAGEEELQLQLALAMSREEAEQEESKTKSDDIRLKMALEKSKQALADEQQKAKPSSDLLDLDFGNPTAKSSVQERDLKNTVEQPPPPPRTIGASIDPWGMASDTASPALTDATGDVSKKNDPWRSTTSSTATYNDGAVADVTPVVNTCPTTISKSEDPWSPASSVYTSSTKTATTSINFKSGTSISNSFNDPWKPISSSGAKTSEPENIDPFSPKAQSQLAEFDMLRNQIETKDLVERNALQTNSSNGNNEESTSPNPFDLKDLVSSMEATLEPNSQALATSSLETGTKPKRSGGVQSLLGEHSKLVNLDDLVSSGGTTGSGVPSTRNPFEQQAPNPFQAKTQKPAMNELMQQNAAWGPGQDTQEKVNPFF